MPRAALKFSILEPNRALPRGIEFRSTPDAAAHAVKSREIYAALWRPPVMPTEVDTALAAINFSAVKNGDNFDAWKFPKNDGDPIFPPSLPIDGVAKNYLLESFALVSEALAATFDPKDYSLGYGWQPSLQTTYMGFEEPGHFDDILMVWDRAPDIQVLRCVKGQGTLIIAPDYTEQEEIRVSVAERKLLIEAYPAEALRQVAKGDWIFMRSDLGHAVPNVVTPTAERLLQVLRPHLEFDPQRHYFDRRHNE